MYRANRLSPEELAPEAERCATRIREWVAATRPLERA